MRRLGRISIFTTSIHKFLVNLKRGYAGHFVEISEDVIGKYVSEKALSYFSMAKPSEFAKTLSDVSTDFYDLIEQFKGCPDVKYMYSYKQLERVLKDQCNLKKDSDGQKVELKKPKEISSDSLQNLSDFELLENGQVKHCPQGLPKEELMNKQMNSKSDTDGMPGLKPPCRNMNAEPGLSNSDFEVLKQFGLLPS